jgi:16S rRNA U1498 N3-methylase RsmE
MLPNVVVRRNFIKFVMDEMDVLFPATEYHRIIAHPPSDTINAHPTRVINLRRESARIDGDPDTNGRDGTSDSIKKIVVAVGPEGGWEDEEVLLLLSKGFSLVSLGPRILRTDMAVSVLLGLAHDWTDNVA